MFAGLMFVMIAGFAIFSGGVSVPISSELKEFSESFTVITPAGTQGINYFAGFYDFASSDNDFNPSITFGNSNSSYAAHFFVVTGLTAPDDITIDVTGIGIWDNGTAIPNYTDTITIPSGTLANSYFETDKFIGQVQVETTSVTSIDNNYGWVKYWDNWNRDFTLNAIEMLWSGAKNDPNFDAKILHHKTTGWTFNNNNEPTPPTELASLRTDHINSGGVRNGEEGVWKHIGFNQAINGSQSEGIILEVFTGATNVLESGQVTFNGIND